MLTTCNYRNFQVNNCLSKNKKPAKLELIYQSSDKHAAVNIPNSVMMGMFAPVVTDVCRTNPWTGLFSGDDLSIPGGVKP